MFLYIKTKKRLPQKRIGTYMCGFIPWFSILFVWSLSGCMPILLCCFDYHSFVMQFEMRKWNVSSFVLFFQYYFGHLGSFMVSYQLLGLKKCVKKQNIVKNAYGILTCNYIVIKKEEILPFITRWLTWMIDIERKYFINSLVCEIKRWQAHRNRVEWWLGWVEGWGKWGIVKRVHIISSYKVNKFRSNVQHGDYS